MDGTTIVNQGYIDGLVEEVTRLRATLEHIRVSLGGYGDSDLVSLTTTLKARCDYLEKRDAELEVARDLLRNVPVPDYRSEYAQWKDAVDDYLETL